jgi:hypothetical protein
MADALTVYRYDVTWMGYEVWIWLIVECNLAIICISVPVLRPLIRKFFPWLSMTTKNSGDLTSFASGNIFKRTSLRVEDLKIANSEDYSTNHKPRFDEESGPELNWADRFQPSDEKAYPSQLGPKNSRMDASYYQHHDHFIGKAI